MQQHFCLDIHTSVQMAESHSFALSVRESEAYFFSEQSEMVRN